MWLDACNIDAGMPDPIDYSVVSQLDKKLSFSTRTQEEEARAGGGTLG